MILRRKPTLLRLAPQWLQRYVLHFEAGIEDELRRFVAALPRSARVLDAGAGEAQYAPLFDGMRYTAIDLGIGDAQWQYTQLDAIADLALLPFADNCFDAAVNVVTLEHVREPARVLGEISRVLRPGGRLCLVTPLDWEEHQIPHDYFRYTRYGLQHLIESSGLRVVRIRARGGFFRLLARRLLAAPQFFPAPLALITLAIVALPALLLPLIDRLDREQRFTLGHISVAEKL